MGKQSQVKNYSTFVAGLNTEAGPLTFPPNATIDEDNCQLNRDGSRQRRLGIDYEEDYSLSSTTVLESVIASQAISTGKWSSVGGDGNKNFAVIQIDSTLYFYDLSVVPLSSGIKSFTVSLTTYAASGATNIGSEPVSIASGRGYLFVSSKKIDPIYVVYTSGSDTIATNRITIKIRDFAGLDDGLLADEEPSSLSDSHKYNLKNQGWLKPSSGGIEPIASYYAYTLAAGAGVYPANCKQWWQYKDSSSSFYPLAMTKDYTGNTRVVNGHYILSAFYRDRATESGITGLAVESETNRPTSIAFYAGRAWYAGVESSTVNGYIYYSQIVNDVTKIPKCYQEADPTSEDISDLVATDGGYIVIPDIGNIKKLFPFNESLIIFADNGIWGISGTDGGFKATDYKVFKITSVGCVSSQSVVEVEGSPLWWSQTGIYTLSSSEVTGRPTATNIIEKVIQSFYNDDIPSISKSHSKGVYDPSTKKVQWLYSSVDPTADQYRYKYDRILNFDIELKAFYPWSITEAPGESPYIAGVFSTSGLNQIETDENVIAGSNTVEAGAVQVVADSTTTLGTSTYVKYFIIVPSQTTESNQWTFGLFKEPTFHDWLTFDGTGVDAPAFCETGYELMGDLARRKQATYVVSFFNRTETSYVPSGQTYVYDKPSSCYLRGKWDWTSSGNSGKWTEKFQAYRLLPAFTLDVNNLIYTGGQTVVVTKNKLRGHGRAVNLKWESEEGKDFQLLGWAIPFTAETGV